jgi:mannose/cellobiose epimerase-like protein (N-acyl-D-glucosamine 2-epimerase family)
VFTPRDGWGNCVASNNGGDVTVDFATDERGLATEFVAYVFRDMASLWATNGWDSEARRGRERLQLDLSDSNLGYRRSMVVGRQLFFFSHAFRITRDAIFGDRAHSLFLDLQKRFWDPLHGGWYFSVTNDGQPADTSKDLYAHAFVLFGLVHYYAIFPGKEAMERLLDTHGLIKRHFRLPTDWLAHSATRSWEILNGNLEQNPHMHLLEAYLSAHRSISEPSFLEEADRMIGIFRDRLLTRDGQKVLEHFDHEGTPSTENGTVIEPGHLYEWYWLLNEYAEIAGLPAYAELPEPVFDWAERHGLDPGGGIYDLVDVDGRSRSDRKRIWPVTEAIKAWTTKARTRRDDQSRRGLMAWIRFIMDNYFAGGGRWHEYLDRNLQPDSDYMPASTPYHVAMAALEVDRLLGGAGAFAMKHGALAPPPCGET